MKLNKKLEWLIPGLLGVIAFIFSFTGYYTYFLRHGIERNILDVFFYSLKIFGFDIIDDYISPLPWTLEVGRWLAPGVLVYTVAQTVVYLAHKKAMLIFNRRSNHIIVSGVNRRSMTLIVDLLENKERVLVVTQEIDDFNKMIIEKNGGVIIIGDIGNSDLLKSIAAHRAGYIVLLDEIDDRNISAAISISGYSNSLSTSNYPIIYTHINSYLRLMEISEIGFFELFEFSGNKRSNCEIAIFSENENTARMILHNYSPDKFRPITKKTDPAHHVAIFGSGELAQSLASYMARLAHYINFKNVKVTFFHENPKLEVELAHYFPGIKNLLDLSFVETDIDVFEINVFANIYKQMPLDVVYLAFMDDELALKVFHKFFRLNFSKALDVVMILNNPESILNRWYQFQESHSIRLHKFNVVKETFTKEAILREDFDKLAQIAHNDYLSNLKALGKLNPENRLSHRCWKELPEVYRNQNRMQFEHLLVKLRALDCTLEPCESENEEYDFTPSKKDIEVLAKIEHRRWEADLILNGWKYGNKRDEKLKTHPNIMIPYEELPEEIKQFDRDVVLNIPKFLAQRNYKIVKLSK